MKLAVLTLALAALGFAQPARLQNGNVQTRPASAGLEATFKQIIASSPQPLWIAYSVPIAEGEHHQCGWGPNRVMLEGARELLMFYRIEQGEVKRIRTLTEDCEIDAGGMPVHWLTSVGPAESVAMLAKMTTKFTQSVNAIGLHRDPAVVPALIAIIDQERTSRAGKQAMSLLGKSNDQRALQYLGKVLTR